MTVLEYSDTIKIYQNRQCIATYPLPEDGVKHQLFSPAGCPPPRHQPKFRKKPSAHEEQRLRSISESVGNYLDFAGKALGKARHRFIRKLFVLSQKTTPNLFIKSIERALKYQVTSIDTIERIAILYLRQGTDPLPSVVVDETFRQRQSYQEGYLTDAPDLSHYDNLMEDDDENDTE